MRGRIWWLALFLSETLAENFKKPVRIRQGTSRYYNTTTPVVVTRSVVTSTRITVEGNKVSMTTGDTRRPDSPRTTDDPPRISDVTDLSGGCIKSTATYTGKAPEIVYVTVDGYYEVTVSASNASINAPTIYETPLQACETTVLPKNGSSGFGPPSQMTPIRSWSVQTYSFALPSSKSLSPGIEAPVTSIVFVTKKTPVPVVPTPTAPPVTFQDPGKPTAPNSPVGVVTTLPQTNGKDGGSPNDNNNNSQNNNNNTNNQNNQNNNNPNNSPGPTSNPAASDNPSPTPPPNPPNPTIQTSDVQTSGGSGMASIINSVINSPFNAPAAPTVTQAPSVVATAGITMTIGATVAVISGTTYRVGTGASPNTIVINSQTIVIGSDGVAFSGPTPTTFAPAITIAGGYEIVTLDGLTISVAQTVAVISGTTFRIGSGATSTTAVAGGKTLTVGPGGVILSSNTIKPTTVPDVTSVSISKPVTMAQTTPLSSKNVGDSMWKLESKIILVKSMALSLLMFVIM